VLKVLIIGGYGLKMECNICEKDMVPLVADLWRCQECELISSDIPPDKTIYDRSYCLKYERYSKTWIGGKVDRIRVETIAGHNGHGALLDFGCGYGTFVTACREKSIDARGFDINPHGGFCDISTLLGNHKTVTFWDSLEHTARPKQIIAGLDPEYVFICTPSTDDFLPERVRLPDWHHYYPGEHCHYFNAPSLRRLLYELGYDIVTEHYQESEYRASGGNKNILTIGGRKL